MNNSNALEYETFITDVHRCVKYDIIAADADLFVWMEELELLFKKETKISRIEDSNYIELEVISYKLGRKIGEISTHLIIAIEKILYQYKKSLTYTEKEKLIDCKNKLKIAKVKEIKVILMQLQSMYLIIKQNGALFSHKNIVKK